MTTKTTGRFQTLALSGGGFRGLYTARILEKAEAEINAPIGSRFDLLAGTSVGGIIALALALEIPAKRMVVLFEEHGEAIFKKRSLLGLGFRKSLHGPEKLRELLEAPDLFGDRVLGDCVHPIIVPAINFTSGTPKLFKTPHHKDFRLDHRLKLIDIALATSAAPIYFPRHKFENWQFVDGGLFANAPGLLALHEAEIFFQKSIEDIYLLSIGTMSAQFTDG